MKVKITKGFSRYKNKVGEIFEVESGTGYWSKYWHTLTKPGQYLYKDYCEVVEDMKFPFKVRVISTKSKHASNDYHLGEILTITAEADGGCWYFEKNGLRFAIDKNNCEIMKEEFKPESGMTFECESGQRGLFVQAGNILVAMFAEGHQYTSAQDGDIWRYLTSKRADKVIRVFEGMRCYATSACAVSLTRHQGSVVWEAKPPTEEITLEELAKRAGVKVVAIKDGLNLKVKLDVEKI